MAGIYGVHYKDRLTADDVLNNTYQKSGVSLKGDTRRQMIMQQLHNQNVKLRTEFVRQDVRLTGSCAGYLVPSVVKAGGLELTRQQVDQAKKAFITGDGRFNWELFCDSIDNARQATWKDAAVLRSAKAFKQIDQDGSGRISRDELEAALKKYNVAVNQDQIEKVLNSVDADGDGDISYPEFVDGMARELVTPSSILGRMAHVTNSPRRQ